jgi:hypothetical protein
VAAVAIEPDTADALVAIIPLHDGEAAFDAGADRRDRLVEPAPLGFERRISAGLVHDAVGDPGCGQGVSQFPVIGFVGIEGRVIALDQGRSGLAVMQVGAGQVAPRMMPLPCPPAMWAL